MFLNKKIAFLAKEFVYGGHLQSLGLCCLLFTVTLILNVSMNIIFFIIPYSLTQLVYLYNHLREIEFDLESNPERVEHVQKQEKWTKSLFFSYGFLLVIGLLFANLNIFFLVTFILVGGIWYTIYFKGVITKYIVGSKNIYISFFIAITIFLVPFLYQLENSSFFYYFLLFVFFRFMINTVFSDIKDIQSDKKRSLKTIPVLFGKKQTLYFLYIASIISFVPLIIGVINGILPRKTLFLIIFVFYNFYYITQSFFIKGEKLRMLSYIIADAEFIFWPISLLIGTFIFQN